jgi:serine/threonine protein kinase
MSLSPWRLVAAAADALDYAHRQKIVHRDVKPSNLLLDAAGRPHITDVGLARRGEGEITVTLDGQILGTPAYMSPEQATGDQRRVDARSDVYSLGVVLYELLTGELPFRGNQRMLRHQVIHDEPRPPRSLNDRVWPAACGLPCSIAFRSWETSCMGVKYSRPGVSQQTRVCVATVRDVVPRKSAQPVQREVAGPVNVDPQWTTRAGRVFRPDQSFCWTSNRVSATTGLPWSIRVARSTSGPLIGPFRFTSKRIRKIPWF